MSGRAHCGTPGPKRGAALRGGLSIGAADAARTGVDESFAPGLSVDHRHEAGLGQVLLAWVHQAEGDQVVTTRHTAPSGRWARFQEIAKEDDESAPTSASQVRDGDEQVGSSRAGGRSDEHP